MFKSPFPLLPLLSVLQLHSLTEVEPKFRLGVVKFLYWKKKSALEQRQVTDQVGSDTQVFSDGVLVLSRCRRLTDPRPLAVNLPHWILWDFREHRLGCIVFLQGWTRHTDRSNASWFLLSVSHRRLKDCYNLHVKDHVTPGSSWRGQWANFWEFPETWVAFPI